MKSILSALALLMAAAATAAAHSKMSGSTLPSGDTVEVGLETLSLTFDRKVRLTLLNMHKAPEGLDLEAIMASMSENADQTIEGQRAVEITSDIPKSFVDEASINFDGLGTGVYMVHWIAVAMDGHTMEGDVHFAVSE